MSFIHFNLLLACVTAVSIAQILFKQLGILLKETSGTLDLNIWIVGFASVCLYGGATLLWIYLLAYIPLNKAYPFMALCYVLVPLMAFLFFGEQVTMAYFLGCALILGGIAVIAQFG